MRNRKSNRAPAFTAMHFALILLCLVLVSAHATMGLYASYKTECSGTDSARVAKFDVTAEYKDGVLTITNNSEVTVKCTLSYNNDGAGLQTGISITFDDDNEVTLQPGEAIYAALEYEDNSTTSHGEIDIDISIEVTQVD